MSHWSECYGQIITNKPDVILKQLQLKTEPWRYIKSPWFSGSEGNCDIILSEKDLLIIKGNLRDRDETSFLSFIEDFHQVCLQCEGQGYLEVDADDFRLIVEYYEESLTFESQRKLSHNRDKFAAIQHPKPKP